jgi:hypothetical protein
LDNLLGRGKMLIEFLFFKIVYGNRASNFTNIGNKSSQKNFASEIDGKIVVSLSKSVQCNASVIYQTLHCY